MENRKAFVVVSYSVCDYEECSDIIAVTDNEHTAKRILKDYIKYAKSDVDFDNIDKKLEDIEKNQNDEAEWIYSESDTNFLIYRNGYYSKDHISLNIEVRPYYNEITYDEYLKRKYVAEDHHKELDF